MMAHDSSVETDYPYSVPSGRMNQQQDLPQSLWTSVHVRSVWEYECESEPRNNETPNILLYKLGFIVIFLEIGSTTSDIGVQYRVWWKSGSYFKEMYVKREIERRTNTIFPLHVQFFTIYKIFKIEYWVTSRLFALANIWFFPYVHSFT